MPIPLLVWGGIALVTVITGGITLKKLLEDDKPTPSEPEPKKIAFFGLIGAGKTTICEILTTGKFKEEYEVTPKNKTYPPQNERGQRIQLFDTPGSYNEQIIKAREELTKDEMAMSIYVLNMKDYMSATKEEKEKIEIDIKTYTKGGGSKIIGTHKDEAKNYDKKIANEIRQNLNVEFEIWDLTRAKTEGEKVKYELLDFILEG